MGQGDEIRQESSGGGLDVPPLTEGGHSGTIDDSDHHLRFERAVELAQHTAQSGIETLPPLTVGVLDRRCLTG